MDGHDFGDTLSLASRLGKLEGMLQGLQTSINAQAQQTTQFLVRVERLEERQLSLERSVTSAEDFRSLSEKVDRLVASDSVQQGRMSANESALPVITQWVAIVISVLALIGVGVEKSGMWADPPAYQSAPGHKGNHGATPYRQP